MRIILINKFLYPKGGDAIVTLATGELLRAHGNEIIFWGMRSEEDPSYPHQDIFVDEVDLNFSDDIKQQIKIAGNMLYSLEAKSKAEKLIQRIGKPDIVHLHNFAHQISSSILHVFKKNKIPCVMTMHDYKLVCASYSMLAHGKICEKCADGAYINCFREGCVKNSKAKSLLNTLEMYLHHKILHIYDLIDVFVSPSQFLKDKLLEMGFKRQIEVLPNFVNPDDFIPQYQATEQSICYVGRLSKEKGVATLINAMKILPDIQLKIIGDGPIRLELKNKCRNENVSNVIFHGYKTGKNLKKEIRDSLFLVIPSECYENNPRSVIEAFALGKPVVGARIGGIPELVRDHETGLTFDPGNAHDLADKIRTLINQPDLIVEMGKRARLFVELELNAEKHYRQLMNIYQQVIAERRVL